MNDIVTVTPVYYLGLIHVINNDAWQQYLSLVGATIELYGGRVLFRGEQRAVMAGASTHERVVTLVFADEVSARLWHDSAEYQALIPLRDRGASVTLVLYV
jgi:uncharacterized protein (DUF1330 family)